MASALTAPANAASSGDSTATTKDAAASNASTQAASAAQTSARKPSSAPIAVPLSGPALEREITYDRELNRLFLVDVDVQTQQVVSSFPPQQWIRYWHQVAAQQNALSQGGLVDQSA